jgi:Fic family protein
MPWNWELPNWPQFYYDPKTVLPLEREFLVGMGSSFACLKAIDKNEYKRFIVEILSLEGLESSRIEGEILDRKSLQSSIKKHFGINKEAKTKKDKESGMAELLCDVYETFDNPLTHEMLYNWHSMLFKESSDIDDCGKYRTHSEPMQIVSNRYDSSIVFFEAPPSKAIYNEMTTFVKWFNSASAFESILGRAAIAHVYFESIHPFEDGNGRIGRVLVEKILSQGIRRPVLIAISKSLEKQKKNYYAELEKCNRKLDVDHWVAFFSKIILQAHEESIKLLYFLIEKSKIMHAFSGQINPRQTKVLLRIFAEGPDGFKGGLSAENYIAITKASRATATRDLTDLVKKKILIKTGELRHTRYWLAYSIDKT